MVTVRSTDDATLRGVFAVKLPVRDLARSTAWYERVFGFEIDREFRDDDGVVRGVAGYLPGVTETFFTLRESPAHARAVAGFNLVNLAVETKDSVAAWDRRLDELGIAHSPVIDATIGWMLVLHDPDGIELHLYSQQRHDIDQTGRPGYGSSLAHPSAAQAPDGEPRSGRSDTRRAAAP